MPLRSEFPRGFGPAKSDQSSMMIDDDIDEIIKRGEDKTAELNSKYADMNLDALNNFKSESLINNWEGEDYGTKVSFLSTCTSVRPTLMLSAQEHDLDRAF